MKGVTHLFCAFVYVGAGAFMAYKAGISPPFDSIAFLLASLEGALLPDVDAPKSLGTKIKLAGAFKYFAVLPRAIAYATKIGLYLPLRLILRAFGKKGAGHRGIMHSLAGLVLVCLFWLGIGLLLLDLLNFEAYFPGLAMIIAGLLFGYLMHLWHDALTVGGLHLAPNLKIQGWLKTGRHEWLLQLFFLIISAFSAHLSSSVSTAYGFLALLFALPASFLLFGR